MAFVTRYCTPWALLLTALAACEPVRVIAFHGSDGEEIPDGGLGGAPAVGGAPAAGGAPAVGGTPAAGGAPAVGGASIGEPTQSWLVDDFEDQDQKANDPGGWWYGVHDGSGEQELSVVFVSDGYGQQDGYALQIVSGTFAEWGSAIGVDVLGYDLPPNPTELEFHLRASRPFEASFHAIDGSGEHFTRSLAVTETWTRFVVRLDQMFFVDGDVVRRLDVTTLDELHWFFFENEPVTVWLDQVSLRSF